MEEITTFDVRLRGDGRVTIPKASRDKHEIEAGDLVTLMIVSVQKRKEKE